MAHDRPSYLLVPMIELPPLPPNPVNFDRPPVAEVALAVQFAGPVTDDATTLGRFWPRIQDKFPIVEAQPALPPMFEDFSVSPTGPQVMFQMGQPASRYWLQTEDRARLVQVQPDRIAYNWRKEPGDFPYPRYQQIRSEFFELYDTFAETCGDQGSALVPTWCEVTYINHIELPTDSGVGDLRQILRRVDTFELLGLGRPESLMLNEQYLLTRDRVPYGRLYLSATPGVRVQDQAKLAVLTLTARGLAPSPDPAGVVALLDEGRDLIVNGFKAMTTATMHAEWGLHDSD